MDDGGSTSSVLYDSLAAKQVKAAACCHYCGVIGVIVNRFPRRGYGRRPFSAFRLGKRSHYG
jgi:hypothetical protein